MGLADALIARIDKLIRDRLDAAISSRLAASAYTAPDNAGIAGIKAKTDLIPGVGIPSLTDYTAGRAALLDRLDATIASRAVSADISPGVDARLNLAVPANPTADSIYERLKTLDDSYTATRAALLDRLDAAISSRASATDYTAVRAIKLDNLDAAISSRLAGSSYSAPDNAGISGIKSRTDAYLDAAISGDAARVWAAATRTLTSLPSVIKSLQYGSIAMSGGQGSGSASIAAVNTGKAVLLHLGGESNDNANPGAVSARLSLDSATSVGARRGQPNNSCTVGFCVVEFF